jgi:hypothetical protein
MTPKGESVWEGVPGLMHWTWRCHDCDAVEYGGNAPLQKRSSKLRTCDDISKARPDEAWKTNAVEGPSLRATTGFGAVTDV